MDIQFCDLCNESVPQVDLDEGRAFRRAGRIICNTCEKAMSEGHLSSASMPAGGSGSSSSAAHSAHSAPSDWSGGGLAVAERVSAPRRVPPSGKSPIQLGPMPVVEGTAGVLFGAVALIFSVGATALVVDRVDTAVEKLEASQARITTDISRLESSVGGMQVRVASMIEESETRAEAQREQRLGEVGGRLQEVRTELAGLGTNLESMGSRLDAAASDQARAERETAARIDGVASRLAGMDEVTRFHQSTLIELEERLRAISQGGGLFAAAQVPAAGGAPAWQPMLPDLSNAQAPIRLEAIYALGETQDLAVVPYVVPMLQDVDLFVRMAAARVLEDLDARSAVPALIDALEDPEPPVTESAMFALRKITGKTFDIEPNESPSERARKIKLWRKWWNEQGAAFVSGS
jgi:hypothetical protein